MQEKTQTEQINEIIDRLIGPRKTRAGRTLLTEFSPRLDVSRPNIHDSKREFLREKSAVESIAGHLDGVITQVLSREEDFGHKEMINRLRSAIDIGATKSMRPRQVESANDLALRNIVQTGFYYNSLVVILEMIGVYKERLKELEDQENEFWSVPNRPPNYYARTIALRLARLYAIEKRKRPTFGIARDGNHPSTDFGRSLEEIYTILGIEAAVRSPAEWAIAQLTEEDINPAVNALAGGLMGALLNPAPVSSSKTTREAIAEALLKGQ